MATSTLPSAQEFFVTTSLYEEFDTDDKSAVYNLLFKAKSIDCFCPRCNEKSIFLMAENPPKRDRGIPIRNAEEWIVWGSDEVYNIEMSCSRNVRHLMFFTIHLGGKKIQKIGQLPSLAKLSQNDLKQFQKILGKQMMFDLNRAHGLFAHGIGVGAFVYLRRVLEIFVIEEAHKKASEFPGWDEEGYKKSRVGDKIRLVENQLPEFFVKNRSVYGIISKGIHELTEEECLQYFPVLSSFLQRVLIRLQAMKEDDEIEKKISTEIQAITKIHGSDDRS